MILEADIEKRLEKFVETELEGKFLKLKMENCRGFPDRTILLTNGEILFLELKRPKKNKRSEQQKQWIRDLQAYGHPARFCETYEEAVEFIMEYESD